MNKPELILENETNNIFWAFEIQIYHLIAARRIDLVIINKKQKIK